MCSGPFDYGFRTLYHCPPPRASPLPPPHCARLTHAHAIGALRVVRCYAVLVTGLYKAKQFKTSKIRTRAALCFNYTLVVIPYGFTPYTLYPRRIHYTLVVIPYSVHYPLTPTRPQTFQRNLTRRTGPHTATRGRNVPPPAQRLNRPPCRPAPTTATGTCPSG